MAGPAALHRYRFADYLALEEASNTKHEFLGGEIYAMAGGTPKHAALAVAVAAALLSQLRNGPCRVYSSDLRIRVLATGLATYPDVTVVCGALEADPESASTVVTQDWSWRSRATAPRHTTGARSSSTVAASDHWPQ